MTSHTVQYGMQHIIALSRYSINMRSQLTKYVIP